MRAELGGGGGDGGNRAATAFLRVYQRKKDTRLHVDRPPRRGEMAHKSERQRVHARRSLARPPPTTLYFPTPTMTSPQNLRHFRQRTS